MILSLASCVTRTSGVSGSAAVVQGPEGYMQESRVVINNADIPGWLKIEDIKTFFVGDLLKAVVTVVSKKHYSLNLQYKFYWYNAQGVEIGSGSWQPLVLYGKETQQIQAVASNSSAKEFKIEIRNK